MSGTMVRVFFVVEVAQGSPLRPDTVFDFLPFAPRDVFAQVVHVVFRLAEHHREHEFYLSRRLKAERRKFQVDDLSRVHEVNSPPAIERVTGESVGMPSEDAGGFATINAVDQLVEYRPAGSFGGLLFHNNIDHIQVLSAHVVPPYDTIILRINACPWESYARFVWLACIWNIHSGNFSLLKSMGISCPNTPGEAWACICLGKRLLSSEVTKREKFENMLERLPRRGGGGPSGHFGLFDAADGP
jgi:hypothetical protein